MKFALNTSSPEDHLFINLSRVEWVDVTAALQTVLVAESALLNRVNVTVALPLARMRARERAWILTTEGAALASVVDRAIARRRTAESFLEHLRYADALHGCDRAPGTELRIVDDYDEHEPLDLVQDDVSLSSAEDGETAPEREHLYQLCFPLRWFSSAEAVKEEMGKFLAFVAANAARGIALPDADSLSEVVLHELVENVRAHATADQERTSHALVAALATPPAAVPNDDECYEAERGFFRWLRSTELPAVAVVVGDSGVGVGTTISQSYRDAPEKGFALPKIGKSEEADQLFWALDRWSTRGELTVRRGTRGLYRLHRIVRKYRGLITLRSGSSLVGWDHGGDGFVEPVQQTRLAPSAGTVVRLWLPPVHLEVAVPSLRETKNPDVDFRVLQLGAIAGDGLTEDQTRTLIQALATASVGSGTCLIIAFNGGDPHGVRSVLASIVEARHPAGVVVCGLPGAWDLLENAMDAVNAVIDTQPRMGDEKIGTEVWGPALVLGDEGQIAWVGADAGYRAVMMELALSTSGSINAESIERLVPALDDRRRTIGSLRADFHVVTVAPDGSVALRWRLGDVVTAIERKIADALAATAAAFPASAPVRTPSLQTVRGWTDIDALVHRTVGMRLAMLVLALRIRERSRIRLDGAKPVIATEDTRFSAALRLLKRTLGGEYVARIPVDAGPPLARGQRLIHENSPVVVYSAMPRSGDAARRVLKEVLREGGRPVAVACLVDARATTEQHIEVWGHEVPVISLVRENLHVAVDPSHLSRISPVTHELERAFEGETSGAAYAVAPEHLASLLEEHGALYVGHIGRPVGRHFTFFVDAAKIFLTDTMKGAVTAIVREWLGSEGLRDLQDGEVWYPLTTADSPGGASELMATHIAETFGAARHVPTVRHAVYGRWVVPSAPVSARPTVIIADWGAITGATLSQMTLLAAQAGATRILAVVCVSQLAPDEEQTLRSLAKVQTIRRITDDRASYLPGFSVEDVVFVPTTATVAVKFITRLSFGGYLANCPVCQTQTAIGVGPFPSRELDHYSATRDQRLSVRPWDEVHEAPPAHLDGTPLPPDRATAMLTWRDLLQDALLRGSARERVDSAIETELAHLRTAQSLTTSGIALLHLLTLESQWLHYAPLNMSMVRAKLAEMAIGGAIDVKLDVADRVIALRALRYASKGHFARAFAVIAAAAKGEAVLLREAAFGAFTYLRRPYLTTVQVLQPLTEALRAVLQSDDLPAETRETLRRLEYRASMKIHAAPLRECSTLEAWMRLRSIYDSYHPHDEHYRAAARLLARPYHDALADLAARRSSGEELRVRDYVALHEWLQQYERDWLRCCEFLDKKLLRLLERLSPILQSPDADELGVDTWPTVAAYLGDLGVAESTTTNLIRNIAANTELALDTNLWARVRADVRWWFERFLAIESRWYRAARLRQFLITAPQTVASAGEILRRTPPIARDAVDVQIDVMCEAAETFFCTNDLLQDLWFEALENALKHPSSSKDGRTRVLVTIGRADQYVLFAIHNNNSAPSERPGTGLHRLQGRVAAFDGDLRLDARPADPQWTFGLEVRFLRVHHD